MKGFATVVTQPNKFYVRFEDIGHRSRFEKLLREFNFSFPEKNWDEKRRAWEMKIDFLDSFAVFCKVNVEIPCRFLSSPEQS